MKDIKTIDSELYKAQYIEKDYEKTKKLWDQIKSDKELLKESIKVVKDKFNENDILKGLAIADRMLINYEEVDEEIYSELIKNIYSNTSVARIIVANKYYNGNFSFLLMSLFNEKLKLTNEQKIFAVSEAFNDNGSIHGNGYFNIKYHILSNDNWTLEEKKRLVYAFYSEEEFFDALDAWEWTIIDQVSTDKGIYDKESIYDWTNEYLERYMDKELVNRIMKEIKFCKTMREIRTQKEYIKKLI